MQGDWRTLKNHSSEMQKFSFQEADFPNVESKSKVVNGTSKQAEKDAEQDLDRRVGDLSLYSEFIPPRVMHMLTFASFRLLHPVCRDLEFLTAGSMHCFIHSQHFYYLLV